MFRTHLAPSKCTINVNCYWLWLLFPFPVLVSCGIFLLPSRRRECGREAEGNGSLKGAARGLGGPRALPGLLIHSLWPPALPLQSGPGGLGGPILELVLRSGSYNLSLKPHQGLIKTCPVSVKKVTHKKIPCMKLKPYVLELRFEILHNI